MKKLVFIVLYFLSLCEATAQEKSEYPTMGYLEVLDSTFYDWVPEDTKIEIIAQGFTWTEGPVWVPEEQCLLFSDVPENVAYKWTEKEGTTVFLNPSGYIGEDNKQGSNGLALNTQGELLLCQTGNRTIAKLKGSIAEGKSDFIFLTDNFNGKRYNAPNDLAVDPGGNIFFTDPDFGLNLEEKELDFQGVYRLDTQGKVTLLTDKWPTPNGIGLSPDAKKLYIANSEPNLLISYDLDNQGKIKNEHILMDLTSLWEQSIAKQLPDGMAVNKAGIIFLAGPDGVLLIKPNGKHLGTIKTDKLTSNCSFNEDESILYITCHQLVLRVHLK